MAWRSWILTLGFVSAFAACLTTADVRAEATSVEPASETAEVDAVGEETQTAESKKIAKRERRKAARERRNKRRDTANTPPQRVEFFQARADGVLDIKFIGKSDHEGRVIIRNVSDQPVEVRLPEVFAGVPKTLAQFGGGGGGGRGGGGGGQGGGGGGQQSVGGGGGGGGLGGGGGGQGGGGGGFFSVAPEQVVRINVPVVCLDHGKRDPLSSVPYDIVPADEHIKRPAVIELLRAFGSGQLQHNAAQAAAWHLNSDLSWNELAAKQGGSSRQLYRPPYFSRYELQAGVAYANEANRLAQLNEAEESSMAADGNEADERAADNAESDNKEQAYPEKEQLGSR